MNARIALSKYAEQYKVEEDERRQQAIKQYWREEKAFAERLMNQGLTPWIKPLKADNWHDWRNMAATMLWSTVICVVFWAFFAVALAAWI